MLSIRKIGVLGRTYRHLNRYRQIIAVFLKYGIDDLIDLLKIDQYIELGLQLITKNRRDPVERLTRAERVRMAFEELGPTFIKLGQVLSTNPGLIPVDFINELAKLQDDVPPSPFFEIRQIVQKELGQPLEELFDFFEERPIASASIGQVHRARLKGDEEVAVKVQRGRIRKTIEVDLEIMLHMATLIERHIEEAAPHAPTRIVEEFTRSLEKEIDYTIEATNMERFAKQFFKDPTIYSPKVFRETSTEKVLTMEFIDGIKISDTDRLLEAGLDPEVIIRMGADLTLKQVFDHGFFHADPHPGNIFVLPNNVICLVDFGMMGAVDRLTREIFVDLVDSIVHENPTAAAQALLRLTHWDEKPDMRTLEREIEAFMGQHLYKPLKDIEIGKLLQHLLELVSRHQLRIPPDVFLMMKALGTVEGIARQLFPDFDMVTQAIPFIKRVKLAQFSPQRIVGDVVTLLLEFRHFIQQFPKDVLDIARLVKTHKLSVRLEHQNLDVYLAKQDQASNRLAFSIIIAALLIGSALIVTSGTPPTFYGISIIGLIGFTAAAVMGIWLLVAILRRGRL